MRQGKKTARFWAVFLWGRIKFCGQCFAIFFSFAHNYQRSQYINSRVLPEKGRDFMSTVEAPRRAIFLDRDGTLNRDTGYVHRKEDWHWMPGVIETLRRFHAVGYLLVVVSNQSGLARGMFTTDDLHALEAWINEDLARHQAAIDAWYYCPHLPEVTGPCTCRKPEPGLILQAAADLNIDLARSWMIGDRVRDVQAGLAAGCSCVLLRPPKGAYEDNTAVPEGVLVAPHLPAAGVHILAPEMRAHRLTRLPGGCGAHCAGKGSPGGAENAGGSGQA